MRTRGSEVQVRFDDSTEGWVAADRVQPLKMSRGQQVAIRRPDHRYDTGEIVEVSGNSAQVRLDSGSTRWVSIAALRFPHVSEVLDAQPVHGGGRPTEPPRAPKEDSAGRPKAAPAPPSALSSFVDVVLGGLVLLAVAAMLVLTFQGTITLEQVAGLVAFGLVALGLFGVKGLFR
jgi:hypothetical protein